MWVFEIVVEGSRDHELVIAESAKVAIQVLKDNDIKPMKTPDGYVVDSKPPYMIKSTDKLYLSERAKKSTTMYRPISEATGLPYVATKDLKI